MLLLTLDEGLAEVGLPQFFFYHFLFSSDGHQEYFGLLTTGAGCTWPGFSLWHCPRSQKTQDKWANLTSANGHTPPYWNLHHHRHNYFGNKHTTNLSSLLQILLRQSFLWILSCVLRKLFLTWNCTYCESCRPGWFCTLCKGTSPISPPSSRSWENDDDNYFRKYWPSWW